VINSVSLDGFRKLVLDNNGVFKTTIEGKEVELTNKTHFFFSGKEREAAAAL
jgi:hypothetical protein